MRWSTIRNRLRKHINQRRTAHVSKTTGIAVGTLEGYVYRGKEAKFNKGVILAAYMEEYPIHEKRDVAPVVRTESHYQMLKRTKQLKRVRKNK